MTNGHHDLSPETDGEERLLSPETTEDDELSNVCVRDLVSYLDTRIICSSSLTSTSSIRHLGLQRAAAEHRDLRGRGVFRKVWTQPGE